MIPEKPRMGRYRWLGLALIVALADQGAKRWIAATFPLGAGEAVSPFFNLVHVLNTGAAFSFLAEAGGWQRYAFIALALAVSVGLTVMFFISGMFGVPAPASWVGRSLVPALEGKQLTPMPAYAEMPRSKKPKKRPLP